MSEQVTNVAAPAAVPATAQAKASARDILAKLNAQSAQTPAPVTPAPADLVNPGPANTPANSATPAPQHVDTKARQALETLARKEAEALEFKSSAEKHQQRVAELEAQLQAWEADRADINKLLQRGKVTPEQLAQMFVDGKLQFQPEPEKPKFELPPDVAEEINWARQKRQEETAKAAEAAAAAERAQGVEGLRSEAEPLLKDFPLVGSMPTVFEKLYEARKLDPDLELGALLAHAESVVEYEVKTLASTEAGKAKLRSYLGEPAQPVVEKPKTPFPKTLTNTITSAVPSTTAKAMSAAEIRAKILAGL